ncbi:gliding motility lipoprotein GldJ, partial [Aquimarina celericrescens]|nr:gliding motility lipoprotein GldJ [Aquimarina celericrescens]
TPNRRMYNAPIHYVGPDAEDSTKMDRRYDESTKRTTIVDNKVRVYKGGSWKDRAYWLDPAQRRFMPQDMAPDYIGFRNAMSRGGTKAKKQKTPRHQKPGK